ncbi:MULTISPECIES: 2-C-methyl-D-erythritol 4-phosphate cytidylyltransferase [unclassified Arsukibacterium]|uniref:2-C-methyl-D-erythritol 4-phosphate cytidylyltransferase n=1 Tax=unclassified Arsukibacterium TaxID=2635278 RepID=UPI000C4FFA7B|nr:MULTISPECIES: 2-C-methyl-D-erythritol 4-phosphate cytidylyltransferase [unclassified Arsukibacterium]MAA95579.1 2-C-methyl-D-erythritol 4-phosphate cytidylyltransferase [Rheinheimera sp.]MBM33841.1 2-C-methyl-D-erythritol 4-phosphate cytidylyltransferase [Rheinheimera sp.]|tara:strand:+ start:14611 stop:15381 length:771 start_codon:yes stop_codon:yes gene_type:complete
MSALPEMAIAAVIPAAGVGKRMQTNIPKQYLTLNDKTILQHSVERISRHPQISALWLALDSADPYFDTTPVADSAINRVSGGSERVHSVRNALAQIDAVRYPWVLVHDAARPLVRQVDISKLIACCYHAGHGGILASPVRDTMKRGNAGPADTLVVATVEREQLWHALTPQLFPTALLREAITGALAAGVTLTDEASAMEWAGQRVLLVEGMADNIKITRPADLTLAAYFLKQQDLEQHDLAAPQLAPQHLEYPTT